MSLQIIRIAGNHTNNLDHPTNALVPSPDTKYSSKGVGSYLDVEVAHADNIAGVSIGFFKGGNRKTKFSVASTDDFTKFNQIQNFASSGLSESPEEFYFDKAVKAKGLRISFLGTYSNNVTFTHDTLKTSPNDCSVAETSTIGSGTVVGADNGTVNDWFSVTQVGLLSKTLADIQKEETQQAEKIQDKELKSLSKDIKKLKENETDECCCDDQIAGHTHSTNKISGKDSNASITSTGDRAKTSTEADNTSTTAAKNNTGRIVTDSKVNNSGNNNNTASQSNISKSNNASTPTNTNTGVKDSLTLKSNEKPVTESDKPLGNLKANNDNNNKTVTPLTKKDNVEVSKTSETVTEKK